MFKLKILTLAILEIANEAIIEILLRVIVEDIFLSYGDDRSCL